MLSWIGGCSGDGILRDAWKNNTHTNYSYEDGSVAALSQLDIEKIPTPFAIITPDGVWHGRGEMDRFARISNLDEDWEATVKKLLYQHEDCILVVVDCHEA
jgi:hypothetical protein